MELEVKGGNSISDYLILVTMVVPWVMGWVIAKGFWSTAIAVFVPPWSWYLVAEWIMGQAC